MSIQTGRSINKFASIFVDSVTDSLVITVQNPNAERQIIINQISYGRGIAPASGSFNTGVAVLQNSEFQAGINYGSAAPSAHGLANIGEYMFFDNKQDLGGKTINFIDKPLTLEPGANCLIVVTTDSITVSCYLWATVLGDSIPVKKDGKIGQFTLR